MTLDLGPGRLPSKEVPILSRHRYGNACLRLPGLPRERAADWAAYTREILFSHNSGGWESKIKCSFEASLLGCWMGIFSLWVSVSWPPLLIRIMIMLDCACLLSHFSHVWLFGTPWTIARQASLSMVFSRQEYWSGLPCLPLADRPNPGIELTPLATRALQADYFPLRHPGSPVLY